MTRRVLSIGEGWQHPSLDWPRCPGNNLRAMTVVRVAIVGGGNMGTALASGLLRSGWCTPEELAVVETLDSRRQALADLLPGVPISATIPACESAVIAVKPGDVPAACAAAAAAGATRLLSIAAGVSIQALQAAAGDQVAVIRSMPNTPALVGQGAAAVAGGPTSTDDDVDWAAGILAAVGTAERVSEGQLDAVTGVSGSGPAYLFLVAEALIDGGVAAGLPRPTADALVRQLFAGAAALLGQGQDPAALRAAVTSPGGTTAAGLRVLEQRATRAAFIDAVRAATERSVELGA